MKARPILFSGPMIRALLEGRKTQTRRAMRPQPSVVERVYGMPVFMWDKRSPNATEAAELVKKCPYGQSGDLLYCREAFSYQHDYETGQTFDDPHSTIHFWADGNPDIGEWTRPKPSIHIPRWASRLTLLITDVRVQVVRDISEADAIAEGVQRDSDGWIDYQTPGTQCCTSAVASYKTLWESINGAGSWDANPWCWALSFSVIRQNVDQVLAMKETA